MPLIQSLIDKTDNFEVVRDQIAQILANEVASQMSLAATAMPPQDPEDYNLKIYTERSNPWEAWSAAPAIDKTPIINVWFDSSNFDKSKGGAVTRQMCDGVYNIDIFGVGLTKDETVGHSPGDEIAAKEAQRALRLVRNILMSGNYTYLDLRPTVGSRWINSIQSFQPAQGNRSIQHVVGVRVKLGVLFNEFAPQITGEALECNHVTLKRNDNGEVLAEMEYGSACVVKPPFTCTSIYFNEPDWVLTGAVWNVTEGRIEPSELDGRMDLDASAAPWTPSTFRPSAVVVTVCAPNLPEDDYPLTVTIDQESTSGRSWVGEGVINSPFDIVEITVAIDWTGSPGIDAITELHIENAIYTDAPYILCIDYTGG